MPLQAARDIRAGMLDVAIEHGSDGQGTDGLKGFCAYLLRHDLRAYCHIFGKLVPTTLDADVNHFVSEIHVVNMPAGYSLRSDGSFGPLPPGIELPPPVEHEAAPAPVVQDRLLPPGVTPLKPRERGSGGLTMGIEPYIAPRVMRRVNEINGLTG